MTTLDETIICMECGGICRLLTSFYPDEPPEPGDIVAYRCPECLERWDVVVPDAADADDV